MKRKRTLWTLALCAASSLAIAQMQRPNNPGMPQGGPGTQPGQAGPIGSQIPDTTGPNTQAQTQQIPKVPDATLTRDVQQQLASDATFAGVQVAAHNGRVELTGSVPAKEDRKKAKEMAKSVPGVTSVKEHLTVGSNGTKANSGATGTQGSNPNATMPESNAPQSAPKTVPDSSGNAPHTALITTPAQGGDARLVITV